MGDLQQCFESEQTPRLFQRVSRSKRPLHPGRSTERQYDLASHCSPNRYQCCGIVKFISARTSDNATPNGTSGVPPTKASGKDVRIRGAHVPGSVDDVAVGTRSSSLASQQKCASLPPLTRINSSLKRGTETAGRNCHPPRSTRSGIGM